MLYQYETFTIDNKLLDVGYAEDEDSALIKAMNVIDSNLNNLIVSFENGFYINENPGSDYISIYYGRNKKTYKDFTIRIRNFCRP